VSRDRPAWPRFPLPSRLTARAELAGSIHGLDRVADLLSTLKCRVYCVAELGWWVVSDPMGTLAEVEELQRRVVRQVHGGAWLPAGAVGVLLLLSAVLYVSPFADPPPRLVVITYPPWAGLAGEQRAPMFSYGYWLAATAGLVAVTGAWYRRRARITGMAVAWRRFAGAALAAMSLVVIAAAVPGDPMLDPGTVAAPPFRWGYMDLNERGLITPLLPLAVYILVLARVERSRALIAAGAWMSVLVVWLCVVMPRGRLGAMNFGFPPGYYLLAMAGPLLAYAGAGGARSWLQRLGRARVTGTVNSDG
jgi:hypothetical protein